jgi:predicted nucleic acid-binding protein
MKLGVAVVDATVIINFARLGLADKVLRPFEAVYVTRAVVRETKLRGRRRQRKDVVRFRRGMRLCSQWDRFVFDALLVAFQRKNPKKSHRGEAETIAQAVREKYDIVLTDDKDAAERAAEYGLRVISSPELFRIIAATGIVPATD